MAESQSESGATPGDRPTAAPFLIGLTIFVLVVIVIGLLNLFGGEQEPVDQQVARAAVGQNDALQRQSYSDYRGYTCPEQAGTEAQVLAAQRDSVAQRGERFVDDVSEVAVGGDRATAKVTYHFDKTPDDKKTVEVAFVRDGDAWKVCSPGPR